MKILNEGVGRAEVNYDGGEVFTIKHPRDAEHWMSQPFPVLLGMRSAEGEVRWMEVRDWLKRENQNGRRPVEQIASRASALT